jgi:hypothetical protein
MAFPRRVNGLLPKPIAKCNFGAIPYHATALFIKPFFSGTTFAS